MRFRFSIKFLIGLFVLHFKFLQLSALNPISVGEANGEEKVLSNYSPRLSRNKGSADYIFTRSVKTRDSGISARFERDGNQMIVYFQTDETSTKSSEFKISKPKPWRKDDKESRIANSDAELPADLSEAEPEILSDNSGELPMKRGVKSDKSSSKSTKSRSKSSKSSSKPSDSGSKSRTVKKTTKTSVKRSGKILNKTKSKVKRTAKSKS